MNDNPYRYQIPGHHYVGDLPRRVIEGMTGRGQHFGIIGGRRCGKTSILKVLERRLPSESPARAVVPVPVHVTALDRVSPGVLFREILTAMTKGLKGYQWSGFAREEEPYAAFRTALKERVGSDLTDRYGSEWMAAILIDEIDTVAEKLKGNGYDDTFFGNLRHLVMEHEMRGGFRLVVTGVNDPEGVINRGSPFNMLATVHLGILSAENVDTLIEVGFRDGMPSRAKERLVELTGRHPYLLQGVLQKLWCPGGRNLDGEVLQGAADSFQQEHNDFARWLDVFESVTRRTYAYLSAQAERGMSTAELSTRLSEASGRGVSRGEVNDALTVLVTHGVIEQVGTSCRISGTMFRDWFDAHAPVATDEVLDILDRLKAAVERLDIPEDVRRRAEDHLERARKELGRGSGPDPGAAKTAGADALRRVWGIVRGAREAAEILMLLRELVPYVGMAVAWIVQFP